MKHSIVLVDQNDNVIGHADKLSAHQQGQLHRAFSIFIFRKNNQQTEILLQQRQHTKYHSANLWTNTCCSHPGPGENIIDAGRRRLKEEMGIDIPLHHAGNFIYQAEFENGLIEHEFDHVLVGHYNNAPIHINTEEVADWRWATFDAIETEYQQHPEKFTPWFKQALHIAISFGKV